MSQDMDDDDDWELEDDDDEDAVVNEDPTRQLDVDICPPNLDQKLYDEIVALREKRLDLGKESTSLWSSSSVSLSRWGHHRREGGLTIIAANSGTDTSLFE